MFLITLLLSLIVQEEAATIINRNMIGSSRIASTDHLLQHKARAGFFIRKPGKRSAETEDDAMFKRAAEDSFAESTAEKTAFSTESFFFKPPKGKSIADTVETDSVQSRRVRRGVRRMHHKKMAFAPGFFFRRPKKAVSSSIIDQGFISRKGHGRR